MIEGTLGDFGDDPEKIYKCILKYMKISLCSLVFLVCKVLWRWDPYYCGHPSYSKDGKGIFPERRR